MSRNLRTGRMLALAVGDGIRAEALTLGALLQSHAGAHFTFALVELGMWRVPVTDMLLCVPSTIAQTVMIERGIVVMESDGMAVRHVAVAPRIAARPHSISDTMFDEQLGAVDPALPRSLRAFIDALGPYGVYADQKAALTLRADLGGARSINLGTIDKIGRLWTDHVHSTMPRDLALRYNQDLATLISGQLPVDGSPRLTTNGNSAPLATALLPQHATAWTEIIAALLRDIAARADLVAS